MRVIFLGSGDFGLIGLQALYESSHEVALAILRPDRPIGRGRRLVPSTIKRWCLERDIPVYQPEKIDDGAVEYVRPYQADLFVVVSYGQILPAAFFELPPNRTINLHASLLPRWRGAAPIEFALLHGDAETGLSVQYIEKRLDTGDVIDTLRLPIDERDNAHTLRERMLAEVGPFLVSVVDRIAAGDVHPCPQDEGALTHCRQIKKDAGMVDWSAPAETVINRFRAFFRWPGSFTYFRGKRLKLRDMDPSPSPGNGLPGEITAVHKDGLEVQCGTQRVYLTAVQPENKRSLSVSAFNNGYQPRAGERMGPADE